MQSARRVCGMVAFSSLLHHSAMVDCTQHLSLVFSPRPVLKKSAGNVGPSVLLSYFIRGRVNHNEDITKYL